MTSTWDEPVSDASESAPLATRPRAKASHGKPKRRFSRLTLVIGAIVLIALSLLGYLWNAIAPIGGQGSPAMVTVTSGEASGSIYGALETAGIINDTTIAKLYFSVVGSPTIRPGDYQLPTNSSLAHVKKVLDGGPNVVRLEVPVGFTLRETAARVAAATEPLFGKAFGTTFSAATTSGEVASPFQPSGVSTLEGLVAAGSYAIVPGETAPQLLREMVSRYVTMAAAGGLTPATTVEGHDAYQLAVMASIVEKEGYYVKNMTKVARVIYNRLADGMPLQMDATILYGLGRDGGRVTPAMLRLEHPYNSYLTRGVTPTAIATTGPAAINAVMHPAEGTWKYFTLVSRDGTEAFATTFAEQLENERLAARNGL
ncbi:MAG: endolytic transglycosylase MltG [Actinomycetota bacterium]